MGTWTRYIILPCLCMISTSQSRSTTLEKYAGEDAVLLCGSNNTFPRWYGPDSTELSYNGTENTDKKRRLSYCENKRDLCIFSLRTDDEGVYTCQAENHSNLITLNVHEVQKVTNLSEVAGTDVELKCALNVSRHYWFGPEFPQIPLVNDNKTKFNPNTKLVKENRLSFCEIQRDLCIKDLKTYDEGEYKCSWPGVGTHTTTLSVLKRSTTSEQTQEIGDNAILRCDLTGTYPTWYGPKHPSLPLIQYTSTKEGAKLNPVKEGRWSYGENKRDLHIEGLKKTDFGKYVCVMLGHGNHAINLRPESENKTSGFVPTLTVLFTVICIIVISAIAWKKYKRNKHRWQTNAEEIELPELILHANKQVKRGKKGRKKGRRKRKMNNRKFRLQTIR